MDLNDLRFTFKEDLNEQYDKHPSKFYLRHIQIEAQKLEELLGMEEAVQHIESTLEEWPDLIEGEIQKFRREMNKSIK